MRPGPGLVVMALAFISGARRGSTSTSSTIPSSSIDPTTITTTTTATTTTTTITPTQPPTTITARYQSTTQISSLPSSESTKSTPKTKRKKPKATDSDHFQSDTSLLFHTFLGGGNVLADHQHQHHQHEHEHQPQNERDSLRHDFNYFYHTRFPPPSTQRHTFQLPEHLRLHYDDPRSRSELQTSAEKQRNARSIESAQADDRASDIVGRAGGTDTVESRESESIPITDADTEDGIEDENENSASSATSAGASEGLLVQFPSRSVDSSRSFDEDDIFALVAEDDLLSEESFDRLVKLAEDDDKIGYINEDDYSGAAGGVERVGGSVEGGRHAIVNAGSGGDGGGVGDGVGVGDGNRNVDGVRVSVIESDGDIENVNAVSGIDVGDEKKFTPLVGSEVEQRDEASRLIDETIIEHHIDDIGDNNNNNNKNNNDKRSESKSVISDYDKSDAAADGNAIYAEKLISNVAGPSVAAQISVLQQQTRSDASEEENPTAKTVSKRKDLRRSIFETGSPLARLNPWISACDLAQPGTATDLQGQCSAGTLPMAWVDEGPGPPTCPYSCEQLRLINKHKRTTTKTTTNNLNNNNNNNNKLIKTFDNKKIKYFVTTNTIKHKPNNRLSDSINININNNNNNNYNSNNNNYMSSNNNNINNKNLNKIMTKVRRDVDEHKNKIINNKINNNNENDEHVVGSARTPIKAKAAAAATTRTTAATTTAKGAASSSSATTRTTTNAAATTRTPNQTTIAAAATITTTTTRAAAAAAAAAATTTELTTSNAAAAAAAAAAASSSSVEALEDSIEFEPATTTEASEVSATGDTTSMSTSAAAAAAAATTRTSRARMMMSMTMMTTTTTTTTVAPELIVDEIMMQQDDAEATAINRHSNNNNNNNIDKLTSERSVTYNNKNNHNNYNHHDHDYNHHDLKYNYLRHEQNFNNNNNNNNNNNQYQNDAVSGQADATATGNESDADANANADAETDTDTDTDTDADADEQQCLDYLGDTAETSPTHLCNLKSPSELVARLRSLRLRHCCERNVFSALHTLALNATLSGGAECVRILNDIMEVDTLATRITCELAEILFRFDCRQVYSLINQCDDCKEAYRRWVCSTLVPYFAEPSDVVVPPVTAAKTMAHDAAQMPTAHSASRRVVREAATESDLVEVAAHKSLKLISNNNKSKEANYERTERSKRQVVQATKTLASMFYDVIGFVPENVGSARAAAAVPGPATMTSTAVKRKREIEIEAETETETDDDDCIRKRMHKQQQQQQQQSNNFISTANNEVPRTEDLNVISNHLKRSKRKAEYRRRLRIRPCLSVCQVVEQKCPYLLPADRAPALPTQYAGEPTFLCLDRNILETGEQLRRSTYGSDDCCYSYCGAPAHGICAYCDAFVVPLDQFDGPPGRDASRNSTQRRVHNITLTMSAQDRPGDSTSARAASVAIALKNISAEPNAIERLPFYAHYEGNYFYDEDSDDMPDEPLSGDCEVVPSVTSRCTIPYYASAAVSSARFRTPSATMSVQQMLLWLSTLFSLLTSCNAMRQLRLRLRFGTCKGKESVTVTVTATATRRHCRHLLLIVADNERQKISKTTTATTATPITTTTKTPKTTTTTITSRRSRTTTATTTATKWNDSQAFAVYFVERKQRKHVAVAAAAAAAASSSSRHKSSRTTQRRERTTRSTRMTNKKQKEKQKLNVQERIINNENKNNKNNDKNKNKNENNNENSAVHFSSSKKFKVNRRRNRSILTNYRICNVNLTTIKDIYSSNSCYNNNNNNNTKNNNNTNNNTNTNNNKNKNYRYFYYYNYNINDWWRRWWKRARLTWTRRVQVQAEGEGEMAVEAQL